MRRCARTSICGSNTSTHHSRIQAVHWYTALSIPIPFSRRSLPHQLPMEAVCKESLELLRQILSCSNNVFLPRVLTAPPKPITYTTFEPMHLPVPELNASATSRSRAEGTKIEGVSCHTRRTTTVRLLPKERPCRMKLASDDIARSCKLK